MGEEKKEPIFKKYTIEQGTKEYEKLEEKFTEVFAELEKFPLIDFKRIYLIIPENCEAKKLIKWGFSVAKQSNSKVCIAAKKVKSLEGEIDNVSKAMNVEFEFTGEKIEDVIDDAVKEKNIVIIPREIVKLVEKKELDTPFLIV